MQTLHLKKIYSVKIYLFFVDSSTVYIILYLDLDPKCCPNLDPDPKCCPNLDPDPKCCPNLDPDPKCCPNLDPDPADEILFKL